jgi:GntR family transcriptional regulator
MAATLIPRGGSVVPKYYQVERALRARIAKLEVGALLPPEPELCEEYGVSRTTLRQAMDVLVSEGMLKRFQGRGTFVSASRVDYALSAFDPDHPLRDRAETYRVLSIERRPAGEEIAETLGLEPGTVILHVRRVAYHANVPMRLTELIAGPHVAGMVAECDFTNKLLTETLIEHHVAVAGYHITVEVGTLDEQVAGELGLRQGLPTLDITRLVLDREGGALAIIKLVTRGDVGRYVLTLPQTSPELRD